MNTGQNNFGKQETVMEKIIYNIINIRILLKCFTLNGSCNKNIKMS